MENKHLNTLKAEEAARKAEEAKAEAEAKAKAEAEKAEAVKKEIEDREKAAKVTEKYGIAKTYHLIKKGELFEVRLKLHDCKEGMLIGLANDEKDAEKLINDLRHYAPNGQLLYMRDVIAAGFNSMRNIEGAHDMKEANIEPQRDIWVDGVEFYTKGDEIRRASDSKLIHTVTGLDKLDDTLIEQLVVPALRDILSKMEESEVKYNEEEEEDEEVFSLYATHNDENGRQYDEDFINDYDTLEEAHAAAKRLENNCKYSGWYIEDQNGEVIESGEW